MSIPVAIIRIILRQLALLPHAPLHLALHLVSVLAIAPISLTVSILPVPDILTKTILIEAALPVVGLSTVLRKGFWCDNHREHQSQTDADLLDVHVGSLVVIGFLGYGLLRRPHYG